ncbi:DNA sulfur modification protein DndB [Brevibacillus borstelensis]|uniref:DNA sulfur modification protein DndB n=1 Tax=Brevibacillus borstelensis TaxID=45462 RepID=UPI0004F2D5E3|nr:DNA sulfur modification protein DndB [Brevibacillus borstelensis]KKX57196.1 hypothetical protein X546_01405 [Brevibacillus borstelensis cifa_chp40]MBE5397288.1 DGQHR domain-containing protein [Brevibacillus borstelensis]WNF06448.1 DNA sulfur modification protein DndB [Brevibacillus borstelensis]
MQDITAFYNKPNQIVLAAIKGKQFNKDVVSLQCSVEEIIKFFKIDTDVQREIDTERVGSIVRYITYWLEGNDTYFSPLIFSARGQGTYDTERKEFRLNMTDKLILIDGQHRISAFDQLKKRLEAMCEQNPDYHELYQKLLKYSLSIQIYLDLNLQEERQLFTDVNTKSSPVHNTLLVMYRSNDLYAELVKEVIRSHPTISEDKFETRAKSTRTKLMTAATLYLIIQMLNEGSYHKKQKVLINMQNYNEYKERTEAFLTLLMKYAPKDAFDRDKYLIMDSKILVAIAKFIYDIQSRYPNVTMESLFTKIIYKIDWTHRNNEFRPFAAVYNNQTKKYTLGATARVHRLFSEYLIMKFERVRGEISV